MWGFAIRVVLGLADDAGGGEGGDIYMHGSLFV